MFTPAAQHHACNQLRHDTPQEGRCLCLACGKVASAYTIQQTATLRLVAPDGAELSGILLLILPPAHIMKTPIAEV